MTGGAQERKITPLGSWRLISKESQRESPWSTRTQAPIAKISLTFTPLQFIDICASLLKFSTDVLNLLPDAANLKERLESDLVQAKKDGREDDEKRGEQPRGHGESMGARFSLSFSIITATSHSPLRSAYSTQITGLAVHPASHTTMSASSYNFDAHDADVILRTSPQPGSDQFKDFRVHKAILSIASTLFHDMFSLPQPPQPATGEITLPVIPVTESPEIFETFLRLIYPIEPPAMISLQLVDDLFRLAEKYMTDGVHAKLKQALVSPSFLRSDPIWVYAIACRTGLDGAEADLAIRHTFEIDLVGGIPQTHLQMMTTETYNRLLASHVARRGELISALNRVLFPPWNRDGCTCGYRDWFYTRLFKDITLTIWETPFLDRRRLDSCLSRFTNIPESVCGLESSCRMSPQTISGYFADILDEVWKLG